jgi:hypothetical protein
VLARPFIVMRNDHQDALSAGLAVSEYAPTSKSADEIRGLAGIVPAAIYFWHFGHQKVERPFWVKRRTIPPQPAVWHFSPSRS